MLLGTALRVSDRRQLMHQPLGVGDPSIATKKTYWESNGQITRHIRVA